MITDQKKMMNYTEIEEKTLELENNDELELEKAMRIQRKITEILISENVTVGSACTILYAFTESIYHYMMFGSDSSNE